jgi:hypothetical protein
MLSGNQMKKVNRSRAGAVREHPKGYTSNLVSQPVVPTVRAQDSWLSVEHTSTNELADVDRKTLLHG